MSTAFHCSNPGHRLDDGFGLGSHRNGDIFGYRHRSVHLFDLCSGTQFWHVQRDGNRCDHIHFRHLHNTTSYNVGLNAGNGSGATVTNRMMSGSSGATLPYTLYRDAARTSNWGQTSGTDTVAGVG